MCRGSDVVVVGGGNSAGQAAVFLAGQVRKVYLLIRGDNLDKDMSDYLARRIEQTPNIEVLCNTEVRRDARRRPPERRSRSSTTRPARRATLKIAGALQLHRRGAADRLAAPGDRAGRQGVRPHRAGAWRSPPTGTRGAQPFLLETSRPGVFAAGDVRVRLDQARRLGRRRGGDGGPVRPRVLEGTVSPELPGVRTPAVGHERSTGWRRHCKKARGTSPTRYDGFDKMLLNGTWREGSSGPGRARTATPTRTTSWSASPRRTSGTWMRPTGAAAAAQPQVVRPGCRSERSGVIRRAASIMEDRRDEIIDWLIRESGSTRIKADVEWQYARAVTLEAATFPSRVGGADPARPTSPARRAASTGSRSGVVGMISPWNFPFHLSSRSVAPAIALGNAVVIKPASDTPVTGGLLLAKIYEEAGLPPGVLNVVIGPGSAIGDAFVLHPVPRVISFTGSTEVGRHIAELAAQRPDAQEGGSRAGRQQPDRDPRRRRPRPRRQRGRLRQVPAPGPDLHGDQPPDRRREGPRRVRRALHRPGPRAESRQPERRGHRDRAGDQQEQLEAAPGAHRESPRGGRAPGAGRRAAGARPTAPRVRRRDERHVDRPGRAVRSGRCRSSRCSGEEEALAVANATSYGLSARGGDARRRARPAVRACGCRRA